MTNVMFFLLCAVPGKTPNQDVLKRMTFIFHYSCKNMLTVTQPKLLHRKHFLSQVLLFVALSQPPG